MSYKNKIYIAFDGDEDIKYYNLMKAWKQNDNSSFSFNDAHDINTARDSSSEETIKRRLRERMENSKVFVLLVGESTKYLYKYVRWEIQLAESFNLPIIIVNINNKREFDEERCPACARDILAVHISFNSKILELALKDWPDSHNNYKKENKMNRYYYPNTVYNNLGI